MVRENGQSCYKPACGNSELTGRRQKGELSWPLGRRALPRVPSIDDLHPDSLVDCRGLARVGD